MFENMKAWLMGAVILAVVLFVGLRLIAGSAERPVRQEGLTKLPACPDSPNCVSSVSADSSKSIDPISFKGGATAALARLRETLAMRGGKEVRADGDYLWFEFRTPLLGFTDDVECLLDAEASRIEIRSASRLGHSDLGANRKRVERIRAAYRPSSASM